MGCPRFSRQLYRFVKESIQFFPPLRCHDYWLMISLQGGPSLITCCLIARTASREWRPVAGRPTAVRSRTCGYKSTVRNVRSFQA
jgi:hypothetical protein